MSRDLISFSEFEVQHFFNNVTDGNDMTGSKIFLRHMDEVVQAVALLQ